MKATRSQEARSRASRSPTTPPGSSGFASTRCARSPRARSSPSGIKAQHDMRIAAKRLRYVLEATEFCFGRPAEVARRRARDLQDAPRRASRLRRDAARVRATSGRAARGRRRGGPRAGRRRGRPGPGAGRARAAPHLVSRPRDPDRLSAGPPAACSSIGSARSGPSRSARAHGASSKGRSSLASTRTVIAPDRPATQGGPASVRSSWELPGSRPAGRGTQLALRPESLELSVQVREKRNPRAMSRSRSVPLTASVVS